MRGLKKMANKIINVPEKVNEDILIHRIRDIDNQKEQAVMELIKFLFVRFVGKNLIVTYKDGRHACIICRGGRFYCYAPDSPYVKPDEWDYSALIDDVSENLKELSFIATYEEVSDTEAIAFIRSMYEKRAEEAKALLSHILNWEDTTHND